METPPSHTLTFTGVLSASKKIIVTKYTHFITLSLFFLPLSFSFIINPTTLRHRLRLSDHPFSGDHQKLLTSYLIYTLIAYTLSLCAIGTITYTTHRSFSGEPVINISDALNSLISSFLPLASTAIAAYALVVLTSIFFLLIIATVLMLVDNMGFVIDYNSVQFMWFSAIMGVILIAIIVYVHVEWSLAFVVVVVESKWGFAPLMRSAYLVKGMRSVSLLVMLYFGVCGAVIVWVASANVHAVVIVMLGSFFVMMFLLRVTAANTVLYSYCKALHGELSIVVAEGFDQEYMSLNDDHEKVPRVVSVRRCGLI